MAAYIGRWTQQKNPDKSAACLSHIKSLDSQEHGLDADGNTEDQKKHFDSCSYKDKKLR